MEEKKVSLRKSDAAFVKTVWKQYKAAGRHTLPWRQTADPYRILVSEVMLQQTQVARVIPKYQSFLKEFPTVRRLASASLGDVLRAWQGLGYNRRAKFLKQTAEVIVHTHKGKWPKTFAELRKLPGVGVYTAGALMNFSYNSPVALIETNIRTVYLHHFFKGRNGVSDRELFPYIERTLDYRNPREWNWALMDYGAYLKETVGNLSTQSTVYKKQSDFKTSNRYLRGKIIQLVAREPLTDMMLRAKMSDLDALRIREAITALCEEGLIVKRNKSYLLP
jgi:A/G-specific adenine glycosylase